MRWKRALVFLVIASPTLLVSLSNIKTQIGAASLLLLAKAVENSRAIPTDLVETTLARANQFGVTNSCQDDVSRAVTTLQVYLLNQKPNAGMGPDQTSTLGRRALSAVEQRLKCTPADGNAWLIRAQVLQLVEPNSPEVKVSMANSYQFAPAESWIMGPRFNFALMHYDFVEQNLSKEFLRDLRVLADYAPPDVVAEDYVKANNSVRAMIYDALAIVPKERRDAVASNVNRLGAALRGRESCRKDQSFAFDPSGVAAGVAGQMEICGQQ